MPAAPPTRDDREVADGDELAFGCAARVVHTLDSLTVSLPHHGVLFAGDCVAGVGRREARCLQRRPGRGPGLVPAAGRAGTVRRVLRHGDPLTIDAAAVLRASADRDSGLQVEHG